MSAAVEYLRDLHRIHATGEAVAETSYYGALERLLNEIGSTFSPPVFCVLTTRNRGAGIPDGGLFVRRGIGDSLQTDLGRRLPERGVLEAKGPTDDISAIVRRGQIGRYLERYGKVLVTNLREFLLLVRDEHGQRQSVGPFSLAEREDALWRLAANPEQLAEERRLGFELFLRRVLEQDAPLSLPKDLAWFLASYAREALGRVEQAADASALNVLRDALSEALGLGFEGEDGEHFFRSTLVQTLFYGVFAAWVVWCQEDHGNNERFTWRQAQWSLRVPMVRALFEQIATPTRLGPLRVAEILDWTNELLNRVDQGVFFRNFRADYAVQYFYEPFLEAYDPRLRRELGVWYTPPEVVHYMVARVDRALREDLDVASGLADPRVVVLDPAVGTGSFLVETLRTISTRLAEEHRDALVADDVKQAATQRLFGFEILPAPYVIAHLQLGLLLDRLGVPLSLEAAERVGVYLTNSLTGWLNGRTHEDIPFPELADERDAAEAVKQEEPILVVMGNPPYNAYAGVSPAEEGGLVEPYKEGLAQDWQITRNYLDDLYIRFYRVAERRIAEQTGRGIVCLISNFSWLGVPSAVVMRKRYLEQFDLIFIDCLNGDSRETGKRTPGGEPDPSIFSTEHNPPGITVGTAISLLVRKGEQSEEHAQVFYRDFWGSGKRTQLVSALDNSLPYESLTPSRENLYRFRRYTASALYDQWPTVVELAANEPLLGLNENRGESLIDIDRDRLERRMRAYLDPTLSDDMLPASVRGLMQPRARFNPQRTRAKLLRDGFDEERIVRLLSKPLDHRWAYVDARFKLWNEGRAQLLAQARDGNRLLLGRRRAGRANDGAAFLFSELLPDQHTLFRDAYCIPVYWWPSSDEWRPEQTSLLEEGPEPDRAEVNLSERARSYLATIGLHFEDEGAAELLWLHALAIGFTPAYLNDNYDAIRGNWPRIPLPTSLELLRKSASSGTRISQLLNPDAPVMGITLSPAPRYQSLGVVSRIDGGAVSVGAGDLEVTAGWGYRNAQGAVMPGQGRVERRPFRDEEIELLTEDDVRLFDSETCDVFLNERTLWRNVPLAAWNYKIGGYSVLKKWLSYRELAILGRSLTAQEAREFTSLGRRIAALVLLGRELDALYTQIIEAVFDWQTVVD
jgi:hypothetical protein